MNTIDEIHIIAVGIIPFLYIIYEITGGINKNTSNFKGVLYNDICEKSNTKKHMNMFLYILFVLTIKSSTIKDVNYHIIIALYNFFCNILCNNFQIINKKLIWEFLYRIFSRVMYKI